MARTSLWMVAGFSVVNNVLKSYKLSKLKKPFHLKGLFTFKHSDLLSQQYYSCAQKVIVATADAVIVRLDSDGKDKLPWTNEERERLVALEASVGHTPEL